MTESIELLMNVEDLAIVGPPENITVAWDIGNTGRRGSTWFTGDGEPSTATLPADIDLIEYDMYMDSSSGWVYQYVLMPSNILDWIKTYRLPTINVGSTPGRYLGVNNQTGTTYTPVLSDEGKLVTLTNAAAITVTLPQDSDLAFPIGARTDYTVLGAGMVTFVAGTGATVKVADTAVSRKTNSSMTTVKIAANTWLVVGDLA